MIHARVMRALEAAPSADWHDDRLIQSLNREFRIFGIKLSRKDLKNAASAEEVSQVIARKID